MAATHDPNITINVSLDAAPIAQAGFSKVIHFVPLATNPLDGLRFKTYSSVAEAQSDFNDSQIDQEALDAATAVFSQSPRPAEFAIAYIDLVGGETYAEALQAAIDYDDSFYGVTIRSRVDADILAMSTAVEALSKIFVAQSDDAGLITAGVPAGLSDLETRERTALCYHDEDTQYMAEAHLARFLVYSPDDRSAPGHVSVAGVNPYTTALTQGQANAAKANYVNVGLPFGGAAFYVDPGKFMTGRPMYEIVTADWLEIRLQEDIAVEVVNHSNRGEKITLDVVGQTKIINIVKARYQQGVDAQHFLAGQTNIRAVAITAADRAAERLRFEGEAQMAGSARIFTLNLAVGRDPVNVED